MRLHRKLVCRPTDEDVFDTPENEGFNRQEVIRLLDQLREQGQTYELVDASNPAVHDLYFSDATSVAVRKKRRISRVFGSARRGGGPFFGKQVPALLVYEDGRIAHVYPHETKAGALTTIRQALDSQPDPPPSAYPADWKCSQTAISTGPKRKKWPYGVPVLQDDSRPLEGHVGSRGLTQRDEIAVAAERPTVEHIL